MLREVSLKCCELPFVPYLPHPAARFHPPSEGDRAGMIKPSRLNSDDVVEMDFTA